MKNDAQYLKKAAELLRSGAALLAQACPVCGTPLFRLGEQVICAKCNKPVVILKATEDESKILSKILRERALSTTEQTVMKKIEEIQATIEREEDPAKVSQLAQNLSNLLDALEKLRKIAR